MRKEYYTTEEQQEEGLVHKIPYINEIKNFALLCSIPIIGNAFAFMWGLSDRHRKRKVKQ